MKQNLVHLQVRECMTPYLITVGPYAGLDLSWAPLFPTADTGPYAARQIVIAKRRNSARKWGQKNLRFCSRTS